ncbi:MAG: hypothetical protein DWQ01_06920 [Planctomycetota bacterium]|nr:MAG: hypothetical protein DWQ01_06920 [Planctomycetota bacterium]
MTPRRLTCIVGHCFFAWVLLAVTGLSAQQQPTFQTQEEENAWLRQCMQQLERDVAQLLAERDSPRHSVEAGLDLEFYGYIKLDAAWDSSRTSVGNFARWVESEQVNRNDDQFSMTPKQTRIGLKVAGEEQGSLKTLGQIEFDFYGSAAENKASPMLRHAFLKFDWADQKLCLLAGQTWDTMSPLVQPTLNYTVGWWQGNIGYRRPQIRLTKAFDLGGEVELKSETALARTITGRMTPFTGSHQDTGQDSGLPVLQERISLSFPGIGEQSTAVGLSGHFGQEEHDLRANGSGRDYDTWSLNLDLNLPLGDVLSLQAEVYTGENVDAYLGGIGQGIDGTLNREIGAHGGWFALLIRPGDPWRFNLGASVDSVTKSDVAAATARTENRALFGNLLYTVTQSARIGLEVSHLRTDYKAMASGESLRVQLAFIMNF